MPTAPGTYVMRFSTSTTLLATSPTITVTGVTFTVSTATAPPLGTVTATIANGPGNPGDWVGLYTDGGSTYLDWMYLNGSKTLPTAGLTAAAVPFTMPGPLGSYALRFYTGSTLLGSAAVVVQ
jgi:hypothetical protein